MHAFGDITWIGKFIVTAITLLSMLGAGPIFAIAFAGVELSGRALAFNLFGAVVGAMFEYCSNFAGINAMVLLAMALYFAAFLCFTRARKKSL